MDYQAIPKEMREARRWLVWGRQGRGQTEPAKKPYYVNGKPRQGTLDSPEDLARLATFEEAKATRGFAGIGFALGEDGRGDFWQGIDLDGVEAAGLSDIASVLPGYVEQSPSGRGLHAIGYGRHFKTLRPNKTGIEAYCEKRFFTVTGDVIRGDIRCVADFTEQVLLPRHAHALHRDIEVQRHRDSDTQILSYSGNSDKQEMGGFIIPDFCRPMGKGVRHDCLFHLARRLKTRFPGATAIEMRRWVEQWHREYLEVIGTKSWTETWADFSNAWDKVRCLEGEGHLERIWQGIPPDMPVPEKLKLIGYDEEAYRIVEFCKRLASPKDGRFFLGCRSLAHLLGWSAPTANKVLRMLVRDGILEEAAKGVLVSPGGPRATEYLYNGR